MTFRKPRTPFWTKISLLYQHIEAISKDVGIEKSKQKTFPKHNLTSEERQSLNELKTRDNIILSNSDKGGAVVI